MNKSLEFVEKKLNLQMLFKGNPDTSFEYEVRGDQPFSFKVELEQAESGFENFSFHHERGERPKSLIDCVDDFLDFKRASLAVFIKELLLGEAPLFDREIIKKNQVLKILISDIVIRRKDQDYEEFWFYQVQPPQLIK